MIEVPENIVKQIEKETGLTIWKALVSGKDDDIVDLIMQTGQIYWYHKNKKVEIAPTWYRHISELR